MKKNYLLEELDCAHCASKMEEGIKKLEGINDCNISFLTGKMMIDFDEAKVEWKEKKKEIEKLIHKLEPDVSMIEK